MFLVFLSFFLVSDILSFLCRGSKDKCPVANADLVVLYNKAQEGIAKQDSLGFDIYNGIARREVALAQVLQTV